MDQCCAKGFSWKTLLLWAWAVLATLFIVWQVLQNGAYRLGYNGGQVDAFTAVYQQATKACQPFPVNLGDKQVGLVNVDCLKQPEANPAEVSKAPRK